MKTMNMNQTQILLCCCCCSSKDIINKKKRTYHNHIYKDRQKHEKISIYNSIAFGAAD